MKQKLFKTSLGLCAGMLFTTISWAACTPTSLYGTCTFLPASVLCQNLFAVGIGSTNNTDKTMNCSISSVDPATIDPTGAVLPPPIPGILFCANKGGTVAPGVNSFQNDGLSGSAYITSYNIDTNGTAHGINVEAVNDAALASLNQYCQNPNWTAIDFVPSHMWAHVYVKNETTGDIVNDAVFECDLPDAITLAWDKKAGAPEQRPYNCTQK